MAACTIRKSLYTPAATPRGSTVPPQTPPQRITQEFESGQGSAAQHTTPIPTSNPQGEDSLSELSEGLEGGGQPHQAHHEAAEEPIPEQTGDSLPLTTPEDGVLSGINGGPDHAPAQREGRPSRQAAQVAATLISQQLDTPNCRPPKRKYVPEASEAPSSALTTASGDTVSGTPEQGPDVNYSSSPSPNVNSQDRQLDLLRSDQGSIPTSPAPASLSRPEGASNPATSTREGPPQSHDVLPAEFANLSEELRAAGTMVGSKESVEHLWHIFDHMRVAGTSRAGITRLDPLVESSPTSISDERIRVLGTYLTREEQNQSHLRGAKALSVLRGRLILVELIDNYLVEHEAWKAWTSGNDDNDENDENEENAVTGSKRRKTEAPRCPLDRYTDILYPDTKGWDVARPSDTIASKASRKQVKAKLNYRIRIGKPLVMMARQNGMAVLGVLSKKMTERV